MKRSDLFGIVLLALCIFMVHPAGASIYSYVLDKAYEFIYPYNEYRIEMKSDWFGYQEYVGKTIVFYEPVTPRERKFRMGGITSGVPYRIEAIAFKGEGSDAVVTFSVRQEGNPKAKVVKFKCDNDFKWFGKLGIYEIPAYLVDRMQEAKDRYIGRKLIMSGKEYTISDIIMEPRYFFDAEHMASTFVCLDNSGKVLKADTFTALNGSYRSELSRVETTDDGVVGSSGISVFQESDATKYSYVDSVIDIVISGDNERFSFVLKNISDSSIKVVWNDAAFVGMDGATSRIMHSGIKYFQREGDQPASVIIRGAKLEDVVIPNDLVYYNNSQDGGWHSKSMYPSEPGKDGKISLMLPVKINETLKEYIFVFDVVYRYNHPELHDDFSE